MVRRHYSSFDELLQVMKESKLPVPTALQEIQEIKVPDATKWLKVFCAEIYRRMGIAPRWQPEYDQIANWLADNQHKGLVLWGDPGRGKTTFVRFILPAIFTWQGIASKWVGDESELETPDDFQSEIGTLKSKRAIFITHVGEDRTGKERSLSPFYKLIREAERRGILIVISTDCTISELEEKYGTVTIRRLKSITHGIKVSGENLTNKYPLPKEKPQQKQAEQTDTSTTAPANESAAPEGVEPTAVHEASNSSTGAVSPTQSDVA